MPRFKPPIPLAELSAIKARNKGNPDVAALLWEIKRYHQIVARVNQLVIFEESGGTMAGQIRQFLKADIAGEPCLAEHRRLSAELDEARKADKKYKHPSEKDG